jgi:hypothetical protein
VAGHPAVVADPVDGRGGALEVGLVGVGEVGGVASEAELQEVAGVAQPGQVASQLLAGAEGAEAFAEALDEPDQVVERELVRGSVEVLRGHAHRLTNERSSVKPHFILPGHGGDAIDPFRQGWGQGEHGVVRALK